MGDSQNGEHLTRAIPSDAAYAVGRFDPRGTRGYIARGVPGAPMRATRADAQADWLAYMERKS